ncbi:class I SAM-dependent methyltransferase [Anaeroselena agilis]|uniref:Class I SAM-dependent methyltransferase n=1 Tax=Anaeroselena agilis TaxID=3063788 RepID=A0ABU3P4A0_9FIRM|nr:class I SAM-dependent methyltransferase [Selenomonadales bacterium 4137-cl]
MTKPIERCRICGNSHLIPIINLGEQYLTGIFPKTRERKISSGPLELVKCMDLNGQEGCGLVQLRHSYDLGEMYGHDYGYRSGLNQSMVKHLHNKVQKIQQAVTLEPGDLVIDIGSNDSTLLQGYSPNGLNLLGIDPTGVKFKDYYPAHIQLIPDFFSARTLKARVGEQKAKVITSISMFYDLESPLDFMRDVHESLADNGIWVFEQSYIPAMLQATAYDTICHEHLEYYALKQIKWMTDRVGLKITDIEFNDVNGGSFSVSAAKVGAPYPESTSLIQRILLAEEKIGLSGLKIYDKFRDSVERHRQQLVHFIARAKKAGKTVAGYGASTKGNVVLQYCGLSTEDIPYIAEVNRDKFGCFTPGTLIPIIPEEEARVYKPDYFLVLPWHFRDSIIQREQALLASGGKLCFPLPHLEVVFETIRSREPFSGPEAEQV